MSDHPLTDAEIAKLTSMVAAMNPERPWVAEVNALVRSAPALLAEIVRLRAEVERLRTEHRIAVTEGTPAVACRALRAERDAAVKEAADRSEAEARAVKERDEARATLANQLQVTVTARQAVSDVAAQRNADRRQLTYWASEAGRLRAALSEALEHYDPEDTDASHEAGERLRAVLADSYRSAAAASEPEPAKDGPWPEGDAEAPARIDRSDTPWRGERP